MKLELPSTKRVLVDKANSTVIVAVAISAFIVTFSLVSSKALWDKSQFQARVVDKKEIALKQLEANVIETNKLVDSYKVFVQQQPNVIGGNAQGEGERDGDNARIVLDALPSKYDFPALATSIQKILSDQGIAIDSITGTDDQVAQSGVDASGTPQPIEIPFEFSVSTSQQGTQLVFDKLQRSIRPMHVLNFSLASSGSESVTVNVSSKTYYQPQKSVEITSERITK